MEGFSFAQVALVTTDMVSSLRFYADVFGFKSSGTLAFWGDTMSIQQLPPEARAMVWWLVGGQKFMELELFAYGHPQTRTLPADWRSSDHGWTRFGIAVDDFDATRAKLPGWGVVPLGPEGTGLDGTRRIAFQDPYCGTVIELAEKQAGSAPGPDVFYATLSVADLPAARKFWGESLGFKLSARDVLHRPQDEALWGLAGAAAEGFVAQTGQGVIEVVCYKGGRPRPADWRISDQGFMNVALGTRKSSTAQELVRRLAAEGIDTGPQRAFEPTFATYVFDVAREIEILAVPEELDADFGFIASERGFVG